jgi:hypothetical protein
VKVSAPKVAGRSKYNVRTDAVGKANRTVDNVLFDSMKEANHYQILKVLFHRGKIGSLELQPRYRLEVNGELICTYVGDFRYVDLGRLEIVVDDCKGFKTPAYKLKKKLMKAIHGIEIREV